MNNGNGGMKWKNVRVGNLEVTIPRMLDLTITKELKTPHFRHYAMRENDDVRLHTLPIIATGTIRWTDENGRNQTERKVEMTLASDQKTRVPMFWVEKTPGSPVAFLPSRPYITAEDIRIADEQIVRQQMTQQAHPAHI